MIWVYSGFGILLYAGIFLFDDSPRVKGVLIVTVIGLGIAGGAYFGHGSKNEDGCERYSSFATDC